MFADFTPPICSLTCQATDQQSNSIIAHLTSTSVSACCPLCGQTSTRIHPRYHRRLMDLPVAGQPFVWQLRVRKFFCDNDACDQRIFTEPQRRTVIHPTHSTLRPLAVQLSGTTQTVRLSRRWAVRQSDRPVVWAARQRFYFIAPGAGEHPPRSYDTTGAGGGRLGL